ncbi:MAG TPA: sugar phosphate isomerase/epimerase family protein [Chthonomonadales bacterium]|nr:sugar phosphate isomerase/epimerase family protein [Chthonomonadales bacterium]
MFRLGVITDEIDSNLQRALEVVREWGLSDVELNSLWGHNVTDLAEEKVQRAARLIREGGFRVCVIGTPAFKAVLLDDVASIRESGEVAEHLECIRRGCALAKRFGAPYVRIFSFRKRGMQGLGNPSPRLPRGGPIPDDILWKIVAGLRLAAEIAEEADVTLVVENVRSCWGNSCWNTARILEAADHPRLKMVWDPGNDYVSGGDPFPEGYEAARPWIAHTHLKNAVVVDANTGLTRWECIGSGDLDFRPMLTRLAADGYGGVVSLETHWRGEGMTPEESSRASFADLQRLLESITAS